MQLKEELRTFDPEVSKHSANKTARATILLLHRALRDKVFSVYSLAAQLIRIFFAEFATDRSVTRLFDTDRRQMTDPSVAS